LQLGGNDFPFVGDYPVKGCHYYSDPNSFYVNQAFWGSGATSCMDYMQEPEDGSKRLSCGADVNVVHVVVSNAQTSQPDTPPPTNLPTLEPTNAPVTRRPTESPTELPTKLPTEPPTNPPTNPPAALVIDTSECEGASLCGSIDACHAQAQRLGLQSGGNELPFVGNYSVKGCHYFSDPGSPYVNQAYWGTGATSCMDIMEDPTDGSQRLPCGDGVVVVIVANAGLNPSESTIAPASTCNQDTFTCPDSTVVGRDPLAGCAFFACPAIDTSLCEGPSLCGSIDACRTQAQRAGLQLGGSDYAFVGNYGIKGCHYYSDSDSPFVNQAYWGTGATSCLEIIEEPPDNSQRLPCGTDVVLVVGGTVSIPTNPPARPLATPNPTVNPPTKSPTPGPTNPPVNPPTMTPTPGPTNPPVSPPTTRPTPAPTNPPMNPPTVLPTPGPTNPPINPPTNLPSKSPTPAPELVCSRELQQCNDGTFVLRNPANNCNFFTCSSGVAECPVGVLQCADGTIVSRQPPDCEFDRCPAFVLEAAVTAPPTASPPTQLHRQQVLGLCAATN